MWEVVNAPLPPARRGKGGQALRVFGTQRERRRAEKLLQPGVVRGAEERERGEREGSKPRQRDLRRGRAEPPG